MEGRLASTLAFDSKPMNIPWHKTASIEESETFSAEFWQSHRDALASGEFWADRIAALRTEPNRRLKLAIENLPLPAAFREAAIAVRSLIREKRKVKAEYKDELSLLYWLAAINSFSIPYSEVLREPGYNVMETIPGQSVKKLPFSYRELGHEHLDLLNKTDVKWIEEAWGAPSKHNTLHTMYIGLWQEFEENLRVVREAERNKFSNTVMSLIGKSCA